MYTNIVVEWAQIRYNYVFTYKSLIAIFNLVIFQHKKFIAILASENMIYNGNFIMIVFRCKLAFYK